MPGTEPMKATTFALAAVALGASVPLAGTGDTVPLRAAAPAPQADAGDRWSKGTDLWTAPVRVGGRAVGRATVEGARVALDYGDAFVCEELNRGLDVAWANGEGRGTARFRAHGPALVTADGTAVIAALRASATTFAVSDACGTDTTFSVARLDR